MEMNSVQQIRIHLDRIIQYLLPYEEFLNCHMVNYICDNYWKKFIPLTIKNSIKTEQDINNAINDIWWDRNKNTKFIQLLNFIETNEKFYLENLNVLTSLEDILENEYDKKNKGINPISIKEFMNEKKRHEVEIMAKTINLLIEHHKNSDKNFIVIDVGDGKGYLSSRLALEYKLKVLGIDANEMNTKNAQERNKKLQRAWNGLTKRAELINQGLMPPKHGKSKKNIIQNITENNTDDGYNEMNSGNINSNAKQIQLESNYKTINEFITIKSNFNDLIQKHFENCNESNEICLVGLHTCGNLSPTSLKVFNEQKSIKIICNVGCCYHLLKEEFDNPDNNLYENKEILLKNFDYGFPLSVYLRTKKFKLGRNARMLTSQSINRICYEKDIKSTKSLYYRALLQVLLNRLHPDLKDQIQIGKVRKFDTFSDYLRKCEMKLNFKFTSNIVDDENWLSRFEREYEGEENYLELFYLIRMSFAPILETIILLDKLLYLKEMSFEKSYMVKLFDPIISPRCYGIIAMR